MTAASEPPLAGRAVHTVPACFNVNGVDSSALHTGDELWTVYQPEAVPMTESQRGWCLVHFVVVFVQPRPGADKCHMLKELAWERISADEARELWRQSRWKTT